MIGIRWLRIIYRYNNIFYVKKVILKLFIIFVLSKFRNRSQIPNSKDRVLLICEKKSWILFFSRACMCLKNRSRSTGFLDLFYGKSEVSVKTLLIFLFYCGQVSRENCCKNGGYSFIIFLASKIKLTDGFMNFKWHKIMKPPHSVWKKNETDGTRLRRGRQFHFFPDRMWTVS